MKQIIIAPKISEKSMGFTPDGKYVFEVSSKANKPEITKAIESIYKVKVEKINTVNTQGKIKNFKGRASGKTKNRKKAIITIKKGQKIAEFEMKK